MKITDAGTPPAPGETPKIRGGRVKLICPKCEKRSLARVDTESFEIPCSRGAVLSVRTSRCTTPDCVTNIRFVLLSIGEVTKVSTRARSDQRTGQATGRYVTLGAEDEPLIVIRLE